MTQCEYCGNNADKKDVYCPTCGAKINHPPEPEPPPPPPQRPATSPPPRPAAAPVHSPGAGSQRKAVLALSLVGAFAILLLAVLIGSGSRSGGTVPGGAGTAEVSRSVQESDYPAMAARFQEDPADKESLLYLVRYHLQMEQPREARLCAEAFLDLDIRDDSGVYAQLAALFQYESPQVGYRVLQLGYERTRSSTLQEEMKAWRPADLVQDETVRQLLELIFSKGIGSVSFEDIQSVKALRVTGNGDVIYHTATEPVIRDGDIVNLEEFQDSMVMVVLDEYLWNYRSYTLFDGLLFFEAEDIYGELEELLELPRLESLVLKINRRAEELTALPAFPALKRLELSGEGVKSLAGLRELEGLEHLALSRTEVSDLSALGSMEGVVSVSLHRNENLLTLEPLAGMHWMRSFHIEDSELMELSALAGMTGLERLAILDTGARNLDFLPQLTGLVSLRLEDNADLKTLPSLQPLTGLETLSITCNSFEDRYNLGFLQGLGSVRTLHLLKATDLTPVAGMPGLEELVITHYSADGFASIGSATGLRRLTINSANSTGSTASVNLSFLSNLQELEHLDLNNAAGFLRGGEALFTLSKLEYLDLSNNTFEGDFSGISRLTGLHALRLEKMTFTGPIYEAWDGIFHYVDYDKVPMDQYMSAVGQLTGLRVLAIGNNKLESLDFAAGMEGLTALFAADNYISSVEPLIGLESLALLDLSDNPVADWRLLEGKQGLVRMGQ